MAGRSSARTAVQVGGAIGLALLATFATERTRGRLADGESAAAALDVGYHVVYLARRPPRSVGSYGEA